MTGSEIDGKQRAELGERMQALADTIIDAAKTGEVECPACRKMSTVDRQGVMWSVTCSCGWSAAGSGQLTNRIN